MNSTLSPLFRFAARSFAVLALFVFASGCQTGSVTSRGARPVLLYSLYFNALGENRYAPDGAYREVLTRLRREFDVRVSAEPLTTESLKGVAVVLIANPNDKAHGTNPPPHHFNSADVATLGRFVNDGGGLILLSNQDLHNCETTDANQLLAVFGLRFENRYTDIKLLPIPAATPVIGGLKWAYYSGNLVTPTPGHPARPRAWVTNDLNVTLLKGTRDEAGVLLAVAEPGRGRVVVATDAGWITDGNLLGTGTGFTVQGHDNLEIFKRLARWAAR